MRMIKVPVGLALVAGALFLSPVWIAGQMMVVRLAFHHTWWKLPPDRLLLFCGPAFVLSLVMGFFVLRGYRWADRAVASFAALWIGVTFWMSLRIGVTSLAFFALGLLFFWSVVLASMRRELRRSFLDPQLPWYQGLPKSVSGVKCRIGQDLFRVGRLDREGAFVFREKGFKISSRETELVFLFRDREIACVGRPIRALTRQGETLGMGLRFAGMSPDSRKKLGDFVETLKGEGYV